MGWTSERPSAKSTYSAKKYELFLNIQKLSGFQKVQSYENLYKKDQFPVPVNLSVLSTVRYGTLF